LHWFHYTASAVALSKRDIYKGSGYPLKICRCKSPLS
jgi:hypothetical protein